MARDKEIKGINVFVRVAGELTREYSDNGKENLPANYTDAEDGDKNVAIYYIKSISGTTFRIETKVNRDLFIFENNACDGLLFRFFVDGQLVRNEVYSSDDIAQKDIVVFGPRVPTDQGTAEVKTFQFSEISNNGEVSFAPSEYAT